MLTEKETEVVLEKFFNECFRYWKMQGCDDRVSFESALDDVKRVKSNPYVPTREPIDLGVKAKFVHYREMDLGRR